MALRPTSCKEAISRWEKEKGEDAAEAKVIELQFQWPPIEKMDGALSTLVACEKLSLSSNMIDKIAGIAGMRNLKILSVGRNYIKSLAGIETVAETLEQLWISYNPIDKLRGIGALKKLEVLYMSNNVVKEWVEFNRLQHQTLDRDSSQRFQTRVQYMEYIKFYLGVLPEFLPEAKAPALILVWHIIIRECPALRDLVFIGNPIMEAQADVETWRTQAANRLPQITKLDGMPIIR